MLMCSISGNALRSPLLAASCMGQGDSTPNNYNIRTTRKATSLRLAGCQRQIGVDRRVDRIENLYIFGRFIIVHGLEAMPSKPFAAFAERKNTHLALSMLTYSY